MKRGLQGRYITISTVGETVKAFIPSPLPPVPAIQWTVELQAKDVQSIETLGRISSSARRVHASLAERPVATIRLLSQRTRLNVVTVGKCLLGLKELGIVKELTGHRRNRVFTYHKYMEILNQGVE